MLDENMTRSTRDYECLSGVLHDTSQDNRPQKIFKYLFSNYCLLTITMTIDCVWNNPYDGAYELYEPAGNDLPSGRKSSISQYGSSTPTLDISERVSSDPSAMLVGISSHNHSTALRQIHDEIFLTVTQVRTHTHNLISSRPARNAQSQLDDRVWTRQVCERNYLDPVGGGLELAWPDRAVTVVGRMESGWRAS